jgi:hypothetical protein
MAQFTSPWPKSATALCSLANLQSRVISIQVSASGIASVRRHGEPRTPPAKNHAMSIALGRISMKSVSSVIDIGLAIFGFGAHQTPHCDP